jgi:uncharacterized metal-binding protein YceD (DUF177 family)
VRKLVEYKIPYTGLKLGEHEFTFEVDDSFFTNFDNEEHLSNVDVSMDVHLEKQSTMILLGFSFSGKGTVPCDRCADDLTVVLEGEEKLIVKYGETGYGEQTDDILVISPAEHEIDISQYVYEFILLSLPQRRTHKEKDCNPEVIRKLKELSVKEADIKEETDPRWAALKKYKNE